MINLKRNYRTITYQLYKDKTPIIDSEGFDTGETTQGYEDPVEMKVNISPATGSIQIESFGNLSNYDHVIITHQMDCPIDENTIINYDNHRYVVRRVAKGLNNIAYAIGQSDVTI